MCRRSALQIALFAIADLKPEFKTTTLLGCHVLIGDTGKPINDAIDRLRVSKIMQTTRWQNNAQRHVRSIW